MFSRRDGERRRFGGRAANARALEPFTAPACVKWCPRAHIKELGKQLLSLTTFSLSNGNLFEVLFGVAGIISQFGGELDLQSAIADGADICKIRFRRPNVDVEPKVKKVK